MTLFGLSVKDYETLSKRLVDLEQRVRNLELTNEDLLNKVLRKIQLKDKRDERKFAIPRPT